LSESESLVTDANVNEGEGSAQTPSTLLDRARAWDQAAWQRLVHIYSPLVYRWCRHSGLQEADAADVGQEVFQAVARALADFRHDGPGASFRGWLRTITLNKVRDFARRGRAEVPGTGGSDAQRLLLRVGEESSDESDPVRNEEEMEIYRRAVEVILAEFEERTRQAFWRVVIDQRPAADVAQELNLTTNAVYLAKSRVLRRIREEFAGIVDGVK
jgi:RNA polymerase sigma-70 factor (ECF subfamily)